MSKTIITVVGKDKVGIIAKVCNFLAENQVNILDSSQTIIDGYLNMMMLADSSKAEKEFSVLADEIAKVGEEIGVQIRMQKEEIFDCMHRI